MPQVSCVKKGIEIALFRVVGFDPGPFKPTSYEIKNNNEKNR